MWLFRPTGLTEMELVYSSGLREWPPRLSEQPIFYPVLNFDYAAQIARDWNTKSRAFVGYVTRFELDDLYISRFEQQIVGERQHEELWIPAEELAEFNTHIKGLIELVGAFFGPHFSGYVPSTGALAGQTVAEQFDTLAHLPHAQLEAEINLNHLAVYLHYSFWSQPDFNPVAASAAKRDEVLVNIHSIWQRNFGSVKLF